MHTHIQVKLTSRSARNQVLGREGEHYRVKVTAPPSEGRANRALILLLSEKLGIAKSAVEITSGKSARLKTLRIHGLRAEDVARALET